MNIDDLTIADARAIAALFGCALSPVTQKQTGADHPYKIGDTYLFRTVTMIDTGVIKAVYPSEIVITDAAWIADTGRFSDALKKAEFSEVEPFPDGEVIIGRGSIVDGLKITKSPRSQK